MSSITKTKYFEGSSTYSNDSSQSPLALLAQTCSNIGKDYSLKKVSTPSIAKSFLNKSSSTTVTNPEELFLSTKSPSISSLNKKSTIILKNKTVSTSSLSNKPLVLSNQYDSSAIVSRFFLNSSSDHLSSQQNLSSAICPVPGCLQCQIFQNIFLNLINNPSYMSQWKIYYTKYSSHDNRSAKISNSYRYHPYSKPLNIINPNDQLPYIYPALSLSLIQQAKLYMNTYPNINN